MFTPVNPKQSFPEMEKNILEYWKTNKTFEKSVSKGKKEYDKRETLKRKDATREMDRMRKV